MAQTTISIRINQDVHEAISALAKKRNVSVGEFVKSLIDESINQPEALANNPGSDLSAAADVKDLITPMINSNANSFSELTEDFKTMINGLLVSNQETFAWLANDFKQKIDNTVFNTIISAVTEANLQTIAIQKLSDIERNMLDWMNLLLNNSIYMSTFSAANLYSSMRICFNLESGKVMNDKEYTANVVACKEQVATLAEKALAQALNSLAEYPDNPAIDECVTLLQQNLDIFLRHILGNVAEAKTYSAESLFAMESLKYYLENNRHLTNDEYKAMINTYKNKAKQDADWFTEQFLKKNE